MKKSVFQIIIIAILLVGMGGLIWVAKTNMPNQNVSDYYPMHESGNGGDDNEDPSLDGYTEVAVSEHTFQVFNDLKQTNTYYDTELSFEDVVLDEVGVGIGD
ncbi:MAG: hypothetical protein LBE09_01545, partial [Christensenellaceae bacterium]|nr:hypothetical protein [Christensenellaceae bacterium]